MSAASAAIRSHGADPQTTACLAFSSANALMTLFSPPEVHGCACHHARDGRGGPHQGKYVASRFAGATCHTPSVADVQCPVLVGRDAELRTLLDAVVDARGGHGGVVFVVGEAGIGKSRLVREMAGQARDLGAEVVAGRGVPVAAGGPYRPLAEALLQALRRRPFPDDPWLTPW